MEREGRDCHDIENRWRAQYEADYSHPKGLVPDLDHHPRSQIVTAAQGDTAAQVGNNGDDMAITAFPALAPRLQSVAYPDNFKPNIKKYEGRSDPNIWLMAYYVGLHPAGDGRRTVTFAQQPHGR
jgi:hypothetical protein